MLFLSSASCPAPRELTSVRRAQSQTCHGRQDGQSGQSVSPLRCATTLLCWLQREFARCSSVCQLALASHRFAAAAAVFWQRPMPTGLDHLKEWHHYSDEPNSARSRLSSAFPPRWKRTPPQSFGGTLTAKCASEECVRGLTTASPTHSHSLHHDHSHTHFLSLTNTLFFTLSDTARAKAVLILPQMLEPPSSPNSSPHWGTFKVFLTLKHSLVLMKRPRWLTDT